MNATDPRPLIWMLERFVEASRDLDAQSRTEMVDYGAYDAACRPLAALPSSAIPELDRIGREGRPDLSPAAQHWASRLRIRDTEAELAAGPPIEVESGGAASFAARIAESVGGWVSRLTNAAARGPSRGEHLAARLLAAIDEGEREAVLAALARENDPDVLADVLVALSSAYGFSCEARPGTFVRAARALVRSDRDDAEPTLHALLERPSIGPDVAAAAAILAPTSALAARLEDAWMAAAPPLRSAIANALSRRDLPAEAGARLFSRLVQHDDPVLRRVGAGGLSKHPTPASVPALLSLHEDDPDPVIRESARSALRAAARTDAATRDRVVAALRESLLRRSPDDPMRDRAMSTILECSDRSRPFDPDRARARASARAELEAALTTLESSDPGSSGEQLAVESLVHAARWLCVVFEDELPEGLILAVRSARAPRFARYLRTSFRRQWLPLVRAIVLDEAPPERLAAPPRAAAGYRDTDTLEPAELAFRLGLLRAYARIDPLPRAFFEEIAAKGRDPELRALAQETLAAAASGTQDDP